MREDSVTCTRSSSDASCSASAGPVSSSLSPNKRTSCTMGMGTLLPRFITTPPPLGWCAMSLALFIQSSCL
jgi:hypothetical protein